MYAFVIGEFDCSTPFKNRHPTAAQYERANANPMNGKVSASCPQISDFLRPILSDNGGQMKLAMNCPQKYEDARIPTYTPESSVVSLIQSTMKGMNGCERNAKTRLSVVKLVTRRGGQTDLRR